MTRTSYTDQSHPPTKLPNYAALDQELAPMTFYLCTYAQSLLKTQIIQDVN